MKSKFTNFNDDWEGHDPELMGTFGLGGGGAGSTGGQANDGGAGPGGMDDASGGGGGDGGYDLEDPSGTGTPEDSGYDGDGEPRYDEDGSGRSSGGGSGGGGGGGHHDPMAGLMALLAEAEARAQKIMEAAVAKAEDYIKEGRDEAAAAIISRAKIAANEVLVREKKSERQLNRFWRVVNQALSPTIRRGNFADEEIASMLGIPGADGKIKPFDLEQLENTPGYQWQFQQGQKAVENAAVGNALSGAHAKAQIEYGQKMAQTSFGDRINYLNLLGQRGLDAASKKSDLAYGFGTAFSDMYTQNAATLADMHTKTGLGLADVHMTAGTSLADVQMRGAESRVGLITGLATAGANIQMAQIAANSHIAAAQISAEAARANARARSTGSILGTIGGAIGSTIGGPIGGAIGTGIGGIVGGIF